MYSNGAVIGSLNKEGNLTELLRPSLDSKPGDRVYLDGSELRSNLPTLINANKMNKIYDLLKTDDNANACFNGTKLRTETGLVNVNFLKWFQY